MNSQAKIMVAAVLSVVLLGIYIARKLQLARDKRQGFPGEDEFTRKVRLRAGHSAFYLSMFLWMAIFLFQGVFTKTQTMLGIGILGQAALYGLSLLYFRRRGGGDADSH